MLTGDGPLSSPEESRRLRHLRRWDPLAFIFLAHGGGLALAGETANPLQVWLLSGAVAVLRLGVAWLRPGRPGSPPLFFSAAASTVLAYGVVVVDGGTESPFFFWVLLLLGWQVLSFNRRRFLQLGALSVAGYVTVVVVTADYAPSVLFRFGLLVAFILTLALGRWFLDRREAELARLDDMVKAIIDDAPMAMAVLDADRDTVLYANGAARAIGIVSREAMARLLLDDPAQPQRITTLAELVVGSGFRQSPLRAYRHIGSPRAQYRIGFHPRRAGQARPLVLVYGVSIDGEEEEES